MCVDPRWLVRARVALVSAAIAVTVLGCGGAPPRRGAAREAPPAAKVLTASERAAWYQACWARFNDRSWDQFRACYADTVESVQVDSGHPAARGIEAAMAVSRGFVETFPDLKGTGELVLVNGDAIVSIYVLNGTHTGGLLGPDGQSMPATGKPIGLRQAHRVRTDALGSKVVEEEFYSDTGTMMAQLGLNSMPARPVAVSSAGAPTVVIAAGTPAELSNVDRLRAQMAAYNSHDAKGVDAYNAPDFVYHDMTLAADQNAKESLAGTLDVLQGVSRREARAPVRVGRRQLRGRRRTLRGDQQGPNAGDGHQEAHRKGRICALSRHRPVGERQDQGRVAVLRRPGDGEAVGAGGEERSKKQEDGCPAVQALLLASDNRQWALLASCF